MENDEFKQYRNKKIRIDGKICLIGTLCGLISIIGLTINLARSMIGVNIMLGSTIVIIGLFGMFVSVISFVTLENYKFYKDHKKLEIDFK